MNYFINYTFISHNRTTIVIKFRHIFWNYVDLTWMNIHKVYISHSDFISIIIRYIN